MAQMKPPKTPRRRSPATSAGSRETVNRYQVYAAVANAQTSRMPVLFTVPLRVMRLAASIAVPNPPPDRLRNVLSPNAGFEVLKIAITVSPPPSERVGFHL